MVGVEYFLAEVLFTSFVLSSPDNSYQFGTKTKFLLLWEKGPINYDIMSSQTTSVWTISKSMSLL